MSQVDGATTYSDTLVRRWEANVENAPTVEDVAKNDDIQTPEEVVRRFGVGFDAGDYDSMQYEYQDWVKRYGEPMDKRQEELYVSICFMKLNLRKLLQKGDSNIGTAANSYKSQIDAATTEIEDRKKKAEAEKQNNDSKKAEQHKQLHWQTDLVIHIVTLPFVFVSLF